MIGGFGKVWKRGKSWWWYCCFGGCCLSCFWCCGGGWWVGMGLLRFKIIVGCVLGFRFFKWGFKIGVFCKWVIVFLRKEREKLNRVERYKLVSVDVGFLEYIKVVIWGRINFLVVEKCKIKMWWCKKKGLNVGLWNLILICFRIFIFVEVYRGSRWIYFLGFNLKIICVRFVLVKWSVLGIRRLWCFKFCLLGKK